MSNAIETLARAERYMRNSDNAYADEISVLLLRAWSEATDQEDEFDEAGTPHLRTFLKTTPLGLAILDLAHRINGEAPPKW